MFLLREGENGHPPHRCNRIVSFELKKAKVYYAYSFALDVSWIRDIQLYETFYYEEDVKH